MAYSKWTVTKNGSLERTGFPNQTKLIRIIHLDDHKLFRVALSSCLLPIFQNLELLDFENGNDAFDFIKEEIKNGQQIDLIVTDITHPGLTGNEFVARIRKYEASCKVKKNIPIVILSMTPNDFTMNLVVNKNIDAYLIKDIEASELIECLENIIYRL